MKLTMPALTLGERGERWLIVGLACLEALNFAAEAVTQWMEQAGLEPMSHRLLVPEPGSDGKIAVSLWLGRDPRILLAGAHREVA